MKRVFTILLDVLLWASLHQIVTDGAYSQYAESLFSFWAWFSLIAGLLTIFAVPSLSADSLSKVDVGFIKTYGFASTVVEMIALAATGHFLFASAKAVQLVGALVLLEKLKSSKVKANPTKPLYGAA